MYLTTLVSNLTQQEGEEWNGRDECQAIEVQVDENER